MKDYLKYLSYILEHKLNVLIEGKKLGLSFWQLLKHDLSKFSRFEFKQYCKYFIKKEYVACYNCINGNDEFQVCNLSINNFDKSCKSFKSRKISQTEKDFDLAWLHHQHNNKHHWQYWLQVKNNQIIAYEMPKKYALEMIADWNAMSRKFQDKNNILQSTKKFYLNSKNIILHEKTKKFVEHLLTINS